MKDIYQTLEELGVPYKKYEHEAVFTTKESHKLDIGTVEQNTKNLFLADEKNQRFYLLTIQHEKRANLKNFAKTVGEKGLHFADADWLMELLGLTPGSVTPLGLANDLNNRVKFYLDADLEIQEKIFVHPNINTATVELTMEGFKKFIKATNHELNIYKPD